MIIIEQIELHDVITNEPRYNSNNHYIDHQPQDYEKRLEECSTRHWIDKFHKSYMVINIPKKNMRWLKKAATVGKITGGFPQMYSDEKHDLIDELKINFKGEGYFVRCENVSLKSGMHGAGPYYDLNTIVESIVTSTSTHTPVKYNTTSIKLYLLPWLTIKHEFRVFVHNKKITAISQQLWFKKDKYLAGLDTKSQHELVNIWGHMITAFFNKLDDFNIDSFSMDIAILNDNTVYFIEINTFGKEYAAGSSLFHWLVDEHILYGTGENIYFRYV